MASRKGVHSRVAHQNRNCGPNEALGDSARDSKSWGIARAIVLFGWGHGSFVVEPASPAGNDPAPVRGVFVGLASRPPLNPANPATLAAPASARNSLRLLFTPRSPWFA